LRRKRVFIDTNIYIYVAIKHPEFFDKCYTVLQIQNVWIEIVRKHKLNMGILEVFAPSREL